jgi:hypothetical protein
VNPLFGRRNPNSVTTRLAELVTRPDISAELNNEDDATPSTLPNWPGTSLDPSLLALPQPEFLALPNVEFLQQDNNRLRNSNMQLQDEAQMLREQLDDIRGRVQPLYRSLQQLLYLPGVQNSSEGLTDRLFAALEELTSINRTLSRGTSKR